MNKSKLNIDNPIGELNKFLSKITKYHETTFIDEKNYWKIISNITSKDFKFFMDNKKTPLLLNINKTKFSKDLLIIAFGNSIFENNASTKIFFDKFTEQSHKVFIESMDDFKWRLNDNDMPEDYLPQLANFIEFNHSNIESNITIENVDDIRELKPRFKLVFLLENKYLTFKNHWPIDIPKKIKEKKLADIMRYLSETSKDLIDFKENIKEIPMEHRSINDMYKWTWGNKENLIQFLMYSDDWNNINHIKLDDMFYKLRNKNATLNSWILQNLKNIELSTFISYFKNSFNDENSRTALSPDDIDVKERSAYYQTIFDELILKEELSHKNIYEVLFLMFKEANKEVKSTQELSEWIYKYITNIQEEYFIELPNKEQLFYLAKELNDEENKLFDKLQKELGYFSEISFKGQKWSKNMPVQSIIDGDFTLMNIDPPFELGDYFYITPEDVYKTLENEFINNKKNIMTLYEAPANSNYYKILQNINKYMGYSTNNINIFELAIAPTDNSTIKDQNVRRFINHVKNLHFLDIESQKCWNNDWNTKWSEIKSDFKEMFLKYSSLMGEPIENNIPNFTFNELKTKIDAIDKDIERIKTLVELWNSNTNSISALTLYDDFRKEETVALSQRNNIIEKYQSIKQGIQTNINNINYVYERIKLDLHKPLDQKFNEELQSSIDPLIELLNQEDKKIKIELQEAISNNTWIESCENSFHKYKLLSKWLRANKKSVDIKNFVNKDYTVHNITKLLQDISALTNLQKEAIKAQEQVRREKEAQEKARREKETSDK